MSRVEQAGLSMTSESALQTALRILEWYFQEGSIVHPASRFQSEPLYFTCQLAGEEVKVRLWVGEVGACEGLRYDELHDCHSFVYGIDGTLEEARQFIAGVQAVIAKLRLMPLRFFGRPEERTLAYSW